tara:strand:+ start:101 stop:523 length:423 start_codon:yes stop_codon:yes gene_type:complete
MGIMDKVKFWKKNDEFDFDKIAGKEMNSGVPGLHEDLGLGQDQLGLDNKPLEMNETSPFADLDQKTNPRADPLTPAPPNENPTPEKPKLNLSSTPGSGKRDLELINSKLDTIKALLASLDQRVANLEKAAGSPSKPEKLW